MERLHRTRAETSAGAIAAEQTCRAVEGESVSRAHKKQNKNTNQQFDAPPQPPPCPAKERHFGGEILGRLRLCPVGIALFNRDAKLERAAAPLGIALAVGTTDVAPDT